MLEMLRHLGQSKNEGQREEKARKVLLGKGERPRPWHKGINPNEIIANYERLRSTNKVGIIYSVPCGTIQTFLKKNFKDRYYAVAVQTSRLGNPRPLWHEEINPNEVMTTYETLGALTKTGEVYGVSPRTLTLLLQSEYPERYKAATSKWRSKNLKPRKSK